MAPSSTVVFSMLFTVLLFSNGFLPCDALVGSDGKRLVGPAGRNGKAQMTREMSLVSALEFKHHLRVCNAYPVAQPMHIYRAGADREKLTGTEGPLAYQNCRDLPGKVKAVDTFDFMVGDTSVGTFSVSQLPNDDAVLLLVIYRHDAVSSAASFESHVFSSNVPNAQLAVIDTYRTSSLSDQMAHLSIEDIHDEKSNNRSEPLSYNTVVAVHPGRYEFALTTVDGKELERKLLVAAGSESYVVIRTGVKAEEGVSFPQSLMIFPTPKRSGARTRFGSVVPTISSFVLLALMVSGMVR